MTVSVQRPQRSVNGRALAGPMAKGMTAGQLARIKGVLSNAALQVEQYKVLALPTGSLAQHEIETDGVVTEVRAPTRFMLGNLDVDSSSTVWTPSASPLGVGLRIKVHGALQGQLLKASALQMESEAEQQQAQIQAAIEQFTSLANFVVHPASPSVSTRPACRRAHRATEAWGTTQRRALTLRAGACRSTFQRRVCRGNWKARRA